MAEEKQPAGIVEGATTGDVEDELHDDKAKSAEDRKAAAALSKLDDVRDDSAATAGVVDSEGLSKAMNKLNVGGGSKAAAAVEVKKVKVDAADVALLVSLKKKRVVHDKDMRADKKNNWVIIGLGTRLDKSKGDGAVEAA